ncbi:flagellar basal body rod protein FlgG [Paenibacillus medicaginis]|uniref:Flagellar hook protein FlgE n=1 Tax=Paenibacillus medicaginis TaxID=1470560 RepID=A0ABV5BX41_9BACL
MLRSLYSGVSGMKGFQTKLDVIGNNIANVNTTGFKTSRVMFKDMLSQTTAGASAPGDAGGGVNPKQIGLGVTVSSIDTLHLPGSAQTTNNPTDMRINGDGFFLIKMTGEQEVPYLTRAGDFHVDANRNLVTSDGMYVCDIGGAPIQIGEETTSFSIQQDGFIAETMPDGTIELNTQIGLATVPNTEGLEKIGGNLYRLTNNAIEGGAFEDFVGGNDAEAGTGAIVSGQLEMSNVELTNEFTEMIITQRGFQANSRIITTGDSILEEVVNLKR